MKKEMIKKAISWYVLLLLVHIAARIFFIVMEKFDIMIMAEESPTAANRVLLFFNIVVLVIMSFSYIRIEHSYADYQKAFKNAIKAPDYSHIIFYKDTFLAERIIQVVLYAVFQIPLVISVGIQGFVLTNTTVLERLFIMDGAWYSITQSALFGFLINVLTFIVILTLIDFIYIIREKHDIEAY